MKDNQNMLAECAAYIRSLENAHQLGRIRDTSQGVTVERIQPGWHGESKTTRIFPGVTIYRYRNGETVLVTQETLDRVGELCREQIIQPNQEPMQ